MEVIISQAGIVDFIGTHPQIPTMFVANVGTAVPIANTIELLGAAITAHGVPLQTVASGNTVDFNIQYASAAASSIAGNAGVASFNSAFFTVDASGYVSISGGSILESFTVDASTPPGTNPVVPNISGVVTVTGGQVAAGTTANVIRTNSLAANTYTIQIQRSQAVASSTVGDNGVSHFDSGAFSVDSNGFVQLKGGGTAATSFQVQANTAPGTNPVVPTAAGLVNVNGAVVANHSVVLETRSRAINTYNVEVQYATSAASTDGTKSGVAHFNSGQFSVDASGFVSLAGGGEAIDSFQPDSGTNPVVPDSNGLVIMAGSGSTTTVGGLNTLTFQLTGLTNHAVLVGAGTTTITKVGPSATTGAVLASNGLSSDPSFQTIASLGGITTITGNSGGAEVPSSGNFNILGTGSITVVGSANTETVQLTGLTNHAVQVGAGTATLTQLAVGTNGQVLIGATTADPAFATLTSSDSSIAFTTGANTLSLQVASGSGVVKTLTGNSGGAISPSSGNINTLGTGSITIAGSGSTLTTQLTGLTNHNVQVGAGTATLTQVAPSATSGIPLVSNGSSADPSFTTAVVAGGGTGVTSFTDTNSLIVSGTTTTGALQDIASVATGQVLISQGTSTKPAFSATPTVTSITFGSGNALSTYVTGTWTPTLKFGGASTGLTYTTQKGEYTQIGNVVHINADIQINNVGSSTGAVTLVGTGLPNCSQTNSGVINIPLLQMTTASTSTTTVSFSTRDASNTFDGVINSATTGGNAGMTTSNTTFSNGTLLRLAGFYFTS